jgi:predicted ester cyclase
VAVMVTSSGTQMGPIAVAGGVTVPATGRKVEYTAMVIYRIQCGQIAEAWNVTDNLTLLRQIGSIADSEISSLSAPDVATPAP